MNMKKDIFLSASFTASVASAVDLPFSRGEVVFVGRSNAGKSSLVNALCGKALAKVAKAPGKTRTINCFALSGEKYLIDLPGYGFAKVSHHERGHWKSMIENYFISRKNIRLVCLVVNAYLGPTELDLQMLHWLRSRKLAFILIVNKSDQLTKADMADRQQTWPGQLALTPESLFWASSKNGSGISFLREALAACLA